MMFHDVATMIGVTAFCGAYGRMAAFGIAVALLAQIIGM